MAEKSLVKEVAESVGTPVGVGDVPVEVVVFFEQAVSTTARVRMSARTVLGRWSFMDAGPLCLLLGVLNEVDVSGKHRDEALRSAGGTPVPPVRSVRSQLSGHHSVVFPLYFSAASSGRANSLGHALEGAFFSVTNRTTYHLR
jgi:hypothetical protein